MARKYLEFDWKHTELDPRTGTLASASCFCQVWPDIKASNFLVSEKNPPANKPLPNHTRSGRSNRELIMYPILNECPICKGELLAVTLECKHCDSRIHGRFTTGPFANLTLEQIEFVELFIKNEGKLTRMQDDLSLSYPTIRNRLHEVIRALGYEPGEDEPAINEAQRRKILEDLENGEISYDDAIAMIKESETK